LWTSSSQLVQELLLQRYQSEQVQLESVQALVPLQLMFRHPTTYRRVCRCSLNQTEVE
jgi:hypothetical protein